MTVEELDKLFELNPQAIVWDGLDGAIVGMASKTLTGPTIVTYIFKGEVEVFEIPYNEEPLDRWGRQEFGPIVAYDTEKIIEILVHDMTEVETDLGEKYDDALEHFEYNIDGAYVGEFTPLHLPLGYENEE